MCSSVRGAHVLLLSVLASGTVADRGSVDEHSLSTILDDLVAGLKSHQDRYVREGGIGDRTPRDMSDQRVSVMLAEDEAVDTIPTPTRSHRKLKKEGRKRGYRESEDSIDTADDDFTGLLVMNRMFPSPEPSPEVGCNCAQYRNGASELSMWLCSKQEAIEGANGAVCYPANGGGDLSAVTCDSGHTPCTQDVPQASPPPFPPGEDGDGDGVLDKCQCGSFLNGASSTYRNYLCAKAEASGIVCMPLYGSSCNSDMYMCEPALGFLPPPSPPPPPPPPPVTYIYVNVELGLELDGVSPHTKSNLRVHTKPAEYPPSAFVSVIANEIGVASHKVYAQPHDWAFKQNEEGNLLSTISLGLSLSIMELTDIGRQSVDEALLALQDFNVNGGVFTVTNIQFLGVESSPLVCTESVEAQKEEVVSLLEELEVLKQEQLTLSELLLASQGGQSCDGTCGPAADLVHAMLVR